MSLLGIVYWSELVTWSILDAKESGKYSTPVSLGKEVKCVWGTYSITFCQGVHWFSLLLYPALKICELCSIIEQAIHDFCLTT